jgi:hypothetical protein
MHAHAHAHLFGFSQVVATADAAAQALSTPPPLTVPSSPVKKKDYNTSSLVRIYQLSFFFFLLSSPCYSTEEKTI